MSRHEHAAFSEGFCPDCLTALGDKDNARVARNFCRGCRRYWTHAADGLSGWLANSGVYVEWVGGAYKYVELDIVTYPVAS